MVRGKFNIPNERFIVYDEVSPIRYAWGGWTIAERARLSSQAFDLRDAEPDGASVQPTLDDPRRCGIQFPLWDKLDELRRMSDPNYGDVRTLAALCDRACPCDVLDRWLEKPQGRRNGRAATNGTLQKPIHMDRSPAERNHEPDRLLEEAALAAIERAGIEGVPRSALEPLFSGDRKAAQRALDQLRADGRVEAISRGRGQRYRIATSRLL